MRKGALVVNADDLGVSKGATLGIVRAHREGIVTSASLAATTSSYQHAIDTCVRTCPDLGIGLHFTLTSGKPVAPVRDVPRLVDADGFLRWRFMPLLAAVSGSNASALLAQIDLELEAQLARLRADGIRPDHVNGERHVHLIPAIFDRVVEAARRHRVPFVRVGRDMGNRFLTLSHSVVLLANGGIIKSGLLSAFSARNRRHLADVSTTDRFASYLYSGRPDLFLNALLKDGPLDGVTEVMVHPGIPEESRGVALGNQELERYVGSQDRRRELDACIEARTLASAWTMTNFRALAAIQS